MKTHEVKTMFVEALKSILTSVASVSAVFIPAAISLSLSTFSTSATAQIAPSIKPLLIQAMRDGQARVVLEGKIADHFKETFKRDAPVVATAKVVQDLGIRDCKRLLVDFEMLGVSIKDTTGQQHPTKFTMPVNFCPDGTVPDRSTYAAIKQPSVILPPLTKDQEQSIGATLNPNARAASNNSHQNNTNNNTINNANNNTNGVKKP
jgi:hypothetical protein